MKDDIRGKVAVCEIMGFVMPFSPYSSEEVVLIKNKNEIIPILMDDRHIGYIRERFHAGKKVAIGFYGGQWHLGIPRKQEKECIENDLLDEDARYISMVERDFSEDIDGILERLGLMHLKVAKKAHHPP